MRYKKQDGQHCIKLFLLSDLLGGKFVKDCNTTGKWEKVDKL